MNARVKRQRKDDAFIKATLQHEEECGKPKGERRSAQAVINAIAKDPGHQSVSLSTRTVQDCAATGQEGQPLGCKGQSVAELPNATFKILLTAFKMCIQLNQTNNKPGNIECNPLIQVVAHLVNHVAKVGKEIVRSLLQRSNVQ